MDLNWQPASPEPEPDDQVEAVTPDPPAAPHVTQPSGLRRLVATAALTVGLLAVGGVSVVMAASPAPSSSSTPSTTQPSGGTNGTHNCPNMGTNGSSAPSSSSGTSG